jgi:hypothetical protein
MFSDDSRTPIAVHSDDSAAYYSDTTSVSSTKTSEDDEVIDEIDDQSEVERYVQAQLEQVEIKASKRKRSNKKKQKKQVHLVDPKMIIYGHKKNKKDRENCTCLLSHVANDDSWLVKRIDAVRDHIRCNVCTDFRGSVYMHFMRTMLKCKRLHNLYINP